MTDPSGRSNGLQIGGLALLAVGVVAAVIGFVSLARNGDNTGGSASQSSASASVTSSPSTSGTPSTSSSTSAGASGTSTPTGQSTAIAAPAPTAAPAPAPAPVPAGNTAAKLPLRVYNNSANIKGLAASAAADFQSAGWTVSSVANYSAGNIPTSTVYFRPGTDEESSASALAGQFGLRSAPRFAGIQDATPGLIVIVTNDFQRR